MTLNGSYPSGHTIRSVILAAMAATLWPRMRPWLIAWVALVTSLLELGGLHVPSDIAGGFLAGGALACAAVTATRAPYNPAAMPLRKRPDQPTYTSPPGAAEGGGG